MYFIEMNDYKLWTKFLKELFEDTGGSTEAFAT